MMCNIIRSYVVAKVFDPGHWYFEYRVSMVTFGRSFFTKPISIPYKKQVIFRPLHRTQVNFDHPHENQVIFDHPHEKAAESISTQETKSFPAEQKINSVSTIHTENQVHFDPPHENQVIFGPHTKIKSISTTHTKNQVIFDPPPR